MPHPRKNYRKKVLRRPTRWTKTSKKEGGPTQMKWEVSENHGKGKK